MMSGIKSVLLAAIAVMATHAAANPAFQAGTRGTPQALTGMQSQTQAGSWTGNFSFVVIGGGQEPRGHAQTAGILDVHEDGRVQVIVNGAGCRGVGTAQRNLSRSFLALDVTFAGCTNPVMNQRLVGYFSSVGNAGDLRLGPADRATTPKPMITARLAR